MDLGGYVEAAGQRFGEFGGFAPAAPEALPPMLAQWAGVVLDREEPGLLTRVAVVPLGAGSLLPALRDELAASLAASARARGWETLGLLLLVSESAVTREAYDRVQGLVYSARRVRVVPWIVDLPRGRLYGHRGPPFGVDPDLAVLAAPSPDAPVPEAAAPPAPGLLRRRGTVPWLTVGLTASIVLVWTAMTLLGGGLGATEDSETLYRWGAALRPHLLADGEYWRLLTAGFLHIGAAHLAMNALSLWWVGQVVEALFGPTRMLFIYLFALVAGSAASVMFGPPLVLSAGASGAIFGLLGALVWYRIAGPERQRLQQVPLLVVLILNLGYGLIAHEIVDNWNHVAGLAAGFLAAAAAGVPLTRPSGGPASRPSPVVRGLRLAAALALAGLAAATVAGALPLPGPSQRLATALTAWHGGRLEEAAAGLESVAAAYPGDTHLELTLAWVYLEQGRFGEARGLAERVLAVEPQSAEARRLLRAIEFFAGAGHGGRGSP
ncbi:membrane associated rhomboid family serine protease [Symbiobacterium terraclitae]|uniref:Membrane associated rhomboid family serine protease n=1 Tax=Symbiobacterium terraclitae TaxID=557451 RepID=A0ABS4JVT8_9FIRM|nr:membrane associated rhomboid family serine protease [Symbiobacterium terraclitae]